MVYTAWQEVQLQLWRRVWLLNRYHVEVPDGRDFHAFARQDLHVETFGTSTQRYRYRQVEATFALHD